MLNKLSIIAISAIVIGLVTNSAEARSYRHHYHVRQPTIVQREVIVAEPRYVVVPRVEERVYVVAPRQEVVVHEYHQSHRGGDHQFVGGAVCGFLLGFFAR